MTKGQRRGRRGHHDTDSVLRYATMLRDCYAIWFGKGWVILGTLPSSFPHPFLPFLPFLPPPVRISIYGQFLRLASRGNLRGDPFNVCPPLRACESSRLCATVFHRFSCWLATHCRSMDTYYSRTCDRININRTWASFGASRRQWKSILYVTSLRYL